LKKCLSAELDMHHGATAALAHVIHALHQLYTSSSPARCAPVHVFMVTFLAFILTLLFAAFDWYGLGMHQSEHFPHVLVLFSFIVNCFSWICGMLQAVV